MSYWITTAVAIISFLIAALTGIVLIPFLKKIHFGQTILEIGPNWHKSKQGTPIMGGFMFIISSIVAGVAGYMLLKSNNLFDTAETEAWQGFVKQISCMLFALLFAGIGFIDDYIKESFFLFFAIRFWYFLLSCNDHFYDLYFKCSKSN